MVRCELCKDPEYIQRLKELCEKSPRTWYEVMQIAKFCKQHPELSSLSGTALLPLMREKNNAVQEEAISKAKEMLSPDKPLINRIPDTITAKKTEAILNKIKKEKGLLDENDEVQKEIVDAEIDITCPICGEVLHLYHNNPQGTHTLKNVKEPDQTIAIRIPLEEIEILEETAEKLGISRSALVHSLIKKRSEKENDRNDCLIL